MRSPFQDLHSPGLDVSGDGRGANTLDGTFTVKQIVFAPNGGPVTNFWATFEQRADGDAAALRGEIKFNADAPDDPEVLGASLFDWQKVAGSFRGVAGNPRSSLLSASGPVDLQISKTGLLTGKVRLGGRTYFFHGALNSSGYVTLIAKSGDGRIVTVKFNVLSSSDRFRVTGSIVDGDGNRTAFTAGRAMHPHVNDSLAGRYTFVMRAETGDDVTQNGWGRIVVSTAGALRILGTTADSRIFEATALPNEDGSWPIHLDTFVTRGTLSGTLNAADLVSSDIRGVLRWFRPATAAGAYRSAMDAQLILEAARYTPPTPLLLQLPFGSAIFRATGNRSTAFDQLVTFAENTALAAVPAPNRSRVVLLADARTGAILGNFQSAHRRLAKFHGIIYQKTGIGMGTFTEGTEAGIFTLAP